MKIPASFLSLILFSTPAYADKVCVAGDAIGHENTQLTYITKEGLMGYDAHFMTALKPKDDQTLREAEKKKDPTVEYCIKGETKHGEFRIESMVVQKRDTTKK